jgi:hypothetical protein
MVAALGWGGSPSVARAGAPAAVDFGRDVLPILSDYCFACHGPDTKARKADLRLDVREGAVRDDGGVVVPGQADESELIARVVSREPDEVMPPPKSKKVLTPGQVEVLRRWIDQGASWGRHWAFEPPRRPVLPAVRDRGWPRNPIDRFILARLEAEGIDPSPEAEKATLIRRVTLDLTGLPPSPGEVAAFLADESPDAYERLVDRLLVSPHYGERWARPWLDLARYADSNGYSIDAPRSIWKYRDWVIDALNRDQPFDEFVTDQLAGDLRPGASLDQLVATGFHRNTPINQEGGIDREQFRVESVLDRANTTATTFLGLTMGCCQCHDHKYDPISQEEYYRLFAFFNNCDEPEVTVASPEEIARRDEAEARVASYLERLWDEHPELREKQKAWELGLDMAGRQKQSQEVREAFDTPFDKRDPEKNHVVFAAFIDQDKGVREHRRAVAKIRAEGPKLTTTMVVRERAKSPRETHLLIQGDYTRPGRVVGPGVPAVLPPLEAGPRPPDRMDLARWLFDPSHPLTARVTVNRMWLAHFGRGLVETENDFGTQGSPPSHPELLDWLATEFVALGWSQKAMHRLIVTSATYRQSSRSRPELAAIDPANRLLARQTRLRLDAELIRDSALSASGLLSRRLGGPSSFPPQPDGVMSLGQMRREWKVEDGPGRYRRGLYTFFWRATPHPMLMVFDAPDATRACTRRERSNTPLQALTLLNDEAFFECAESLSGRVLRDGPPDDAGRLEYAFRLGVARAPRESESRRLTGLLSEIRGETGTSEREAWTTVARVLLNLDEFITRE